MLGTRDRLEAFEFFFALSVVSIPICHGATCVPISEISTQGSQNVGYITRVLQFLSQPLMFSSCFLILILMTLVAGLLDDDVQIFVHDGGT